MANILGDALERAHTETRLQAQNAALEARVAERTVRLAATVEALQTEIVERQRAESVLQRYATLLRSQYQLFDLAHDAIIVRDLDDTITFWNNGARALYGWQRVEALGQPTRLLLRTVSLSTLEEAQAALVAVGWWQGELIHRTRDGADRTVLSRQVLQRDDTGTPAAILEINTTTRLRRASRRVRGGRDGACDGRGTPPPSGAGGRRARPGRGAHRGRAAAARPAAGGARQPG